MPEKSSERGGALLIVVWIAAVLGGFTLLMTFQGTPGETGHVSVDWPPESALERTTDRHSLTMFLHPRCPCSKASLRELERAMVRMQDTTTVQLVFVIPPGVADGWGDTSLYKSALSVPQIRVVRDRDGTEARRFGAVTSGQTFLHGPDGHLLFSGGITSSRAHEGDNLGSLAIQSIAAGRDPVRRSAPVYGCPLLDDNS